MMDRIKEQSHEAIYLEPLSVETCTMFKKPKVSSGVKSETTCCYEGRAAKVKPQRPPKTILILFRKR